MRIVVVGATGNAGTAVLRALAAQPRVTEVVGVARRPPKDPAPPYDGVTWVAADVAPPGLDPSSDPPAVAPLAEAFAGADAVVHLAWVVQPNRRRHQLRLINVAGTRVVAKAAVAAGVPHLVVASSLGVYSPVHDDVPRTESWPAGGIASSHYSVDKAAQEAVLDELEAAHPEITVSRMRTSLVFQPDAGAEVARLFVGPLVPAPLLAPGRLPVAPLWKGIRAQVTHADDAAQAYLRAILVAADAREEGSRGHASPAHGAFNVAAEPLLRAQQFADVLDHGRYVSLPVGLVRAVVATAYRLHLVAADPGWVDMARLAPVMDSTKVRRVLGWTPEHDAVEALRETLVGVAEGRSTSSEALGR